MAISSRCCMQGPLKAASTGTRRASCESKFKQVPQPIFWMYFDVQGPLKAAVYRDEAGELHTSAATCTHLGCVVAWNPHEKTFDVSALSYCWTSRCWCTHQMLTHVLRLSERQH